MLFTGDFYRLSSQYSKIQNTYSLSGGIRIPVNANLNDYVTPGNYYCNSDSDVAAMLNAPFDSSFTLKVEYAIGTGYPCQTARRYGDGNQAYRIKIGSGWGEWIKMTLATIPITPNTTYGGSIKAWKTGNIITINIQTGWLSWSNEGYFVVGWFNKAPLAYISREVIFMNGDARPLGTGNVTINNTEIRIYPPVAWTAGAYAHIVATIAFFV